MALPGWLTVLELLSADTFITQAVVFAQGTDTWLVAVQEEKQFSQCATPPTP